jgi:hypothetical protein
MLPTIACDWAAVEAVCQWFSVIAGFGAAWLWLKSATPPSSTTFSITVTRSDSPMGQPLGGGPLGGTYVGHGYSPELNQPGTDLANQSKLSARAARVTAASVFLQALAVLVHSN